MTSFAPVHQILAAHWIGVIIFAFFPIAWIVLWQRGRQAMRRQGTVCRECLYDLTGNLSGVCPERGTPVPEKREILA